MLLFPQLLTSTVLVPYHPLEQFSDHVLIISGFLSTSIVLRLLSFLYRRAYAFY